MFQALLKCQSHPTETGDKDDLCRAVPPEGTSQKYQRTGLQVPAENVSEHLPNLSEALAPAVLHCSNFSLHVSLRHQILHELLF